MKEQKMSEQKTAADRKLRTIITQDAEVDDQNSLRHFLLYANEVELQGIIQTSSVFHWKGKPGVKTPETRFNEFIRAYEKVPPYDRPFRWTGTDWMQRVIDDYAAILPNLKKHADGYPDAEYLRSITKIGNVGFSGDMSGKTEGSELIRTRILDDDPRPLYIQVWGGTNTIAQALKNIETEYGPEGEGTQESWNVLHEKISKKVIITACGEQDCTYRNYIAENWPDIQFAVMLQMECYAYPWMLIPDSESRDSLKASYMKEHILLDGNPLTEHYCTWLDGKVYEGEGEDDQYGSNEKLAGKFRAFLGEDFPEYRKYDFLSEGDSPTFFWMFDWGLRTEEDFGNGGFSGRYRLAAGEKNSKGQPLNYWNVEKDAFTDRSGNVTMQGSMLRYVRDIQHDMAARARWGIVDAFEKGEHAPGLTIREGLDFTLKADKESKETASETALLFHADAQNADGGNVRVTWRIYGDACVGESCKAAFLECGEGGKEARLILPCRKEGDTIHVIACAEEDGPEQLRRYRQIIVRITG